MSPKHKPIPKGAIAAAPFAIFVLSALWHWLYDWAPCYALIPLAPIAESVWEHGKIVWYPTLLYWCLIKICAPKQNGHVLLGVATISAAVGVWGTFCLYYACHAGLGIGQHLAADLLCELAALAMGAMVAARYESVAALNATSSRFFALLWILSAATFGFCALYPPTLPLFAKFC